PVWADKREREINVTIGFVVSVDIPAGGGILRLACATIYRAWVDGVFLGAGPARTAHGYFRIDDWAVPAGTHTVAIEVTGYNVDSYAYLDQPSFLQAEIVAGTQVLAATGHDFDAVELTGRIQRTARYSFQRALSEYYRLQPGYDSWRNGESDGHQVTLSEQPALPLLGRRAPYPTFGQVQPVAYLGGGAISRGNMPKSPSRDRALTLPGEGGAYKGYPEGDLTVCPSMELQALQMHQHEDVNQDYVPNQVRHMATMSWTRHDFGALKCGFPGVQVTVHEPTTIFLAFDEILLPDGSLNWKRLGTVNLIGFELQPGSYTLECCEPYTVRYLEVWCLEGNVEVSDLWVREYVNPAAEGARFACADDRINRIFEAARKTFAQNAVDIFMDCPSRERAGWLGDSFFASRVEPLLTGDTAIETDFIENFLLHPDDPHLPAGMFPMCYPSDHRDNNFIPNWALWFMLELREYRTRGGDEKIIEGLRPQVEQCLALFTTWENSDGLLEKLPGWVFVEWSKANELTQDVNYPSNMLYAAALEAIAGLYDIPALATKADAVRRTVHEQSFDGRFFRDHALRIDDVLQVQPECTETCQYFALFTHTATPEVDAAFAQRILTEFTPEKRAQGKYAEIFPANLIFGTTLRFELLSRADQRRELLAELIHYLLLMADSTGTLWEHLDTQASCSHGFASNAAGLILHAALGIRELDVVGKRISLQVGGNGFAWASGRVPVPGGHLEFSWWQEEGAYKHRVSAPLGYTVTVLV
ncbi:MAG: hypothetical protein WCJ56_04405, partial [bacterium]